jgi:uncharacterized integral membrane protein (TIGR00698 family)
MAEIAQAANSPIESRHSPWRELFRKEDWWAIWIGLGLIAIAVSLFAGGSSIRWIAVAPQKWNHFSDLALQVKTHALQYVALFVLWSAAFGLGANALGIRISRFLPSFLLVYLAAACIYFLGQWDQAAHYNLEPPLVALGAGLLVSNTLRLPRWLEPGLRVEFYIKTGIVLLGAGLPLTLIAWAGPIAMVQAAIVSLATFGAIFYSAVRLGLDRRLAATLGTGGAVCGVSGAIAVGGAVGARRQEVSVAISLVVAWAIVMIFVLPIVARLLRLPTGVAGAWIGTSEFADAAGLAAAQTYGGYAGNVTGIAGSPDAAINAFTLMKVIGRDMWIGVWAFVLSLVATTHWERTGVQGHSNAAEIWNRFPKFVLGFLVASAAMTLVTRGFDYAVYKKDVLPALVGPLQALRTWAFTFAFLSIGLTTRFREFASVGARPFYAFSIGVAVNVTLGFVLSTQVFAGFWNRLGQ